ncbi:MAG: response regulator [SAR324 cluster bacterium]|nr:response regulator [SAR324 cluster bacterium]
MSKSNRKPIDILLVEDNPGDIRLTEEALKESKIVNTLHVVMDGVQALNYLFRKGIYADARLPNLILLDLNLPKKNGREVLKEIKKDSLLRLIPVVILTTSKADEDVLKSYSLHANCYITKPVDLERFIEIVRSIENFWFRVVELPSH